MTILDWDGHDCFAAEHGEWCVWIEPLDLEGKGRFDWSVDIVDSSVGSGATSVQSGVETSLASAKLAAAKAVRHLNSAGAKSAQITLHEFQADSTDANSPQTGLRRQ